MELDKKELKDKLDKFNNFLLVDLEKVIKDEMIIQTVPVEVLILQSPEYNKYDHTAQSRGLIAVGKKQYRVKVTAYFSVNRIEIQSKIFSITIRFDFGGEVEGGA
ncbi:MAG: hypothetical protein OWS74_07110 [Firmicutes bacterium]|nr:hypothetical protein [Bacillota bacterium]